MDGRPTWTDCDEAGDYFVPNVLSPRDLVLRPDNMNETVPRTLIPNILDHIFIPPVYEVYRGYIVLLFRFVCVCVCKLFSVKDFSATT